MHSLYERIRAGERIGMQEAETLLEQAPLHELGTLAHDLRLRRHPEPIVTYVADRNINYSNVCSCGCRFCAFYKVPGKLGGYVISREELADKIQETIALGGTQILMQGGHHPDLPFSFYEELLDYIRSEFPSIHVHAFSPPEIHYFAGLYGLSVAEVVTRLRRAGLHSIPGGGAEILVNAVRERVSPNKCSADEWLAVMEEAHAQGLRTTATMMFGHEEQPRHRLEHLFALRELQDRTGGFTAFIPWSFQPENTKIQVRPATAPEYLRMLALSRIVLDNVDNIQVSWVTMGPKIAQLALYFGGNDFGSLMIEENVVKAAGVAFRISRQEIHRLIEAAGFRPVQRTMTYQPVDLGS